MTTWLLVVLPDDRVLLAPKAPLSREEERRIGEMWAGRGKSRLTILVDPVEIRDLREPHR